ncbi:MAG TPA: tRNA (adenosine(37)-N6)-threonylcarbamoyltransferase complex transferase subunit TsaD [Tepidisphaeraceae bacterium]|jgi:N6-L-threonylcarbamoyladenine synthase|nr:tRNA (adenosine(37)-N6)-threonylcarbamoyltransferase complex transferase subunit TsaD [Tepidisphaeraceae bacterium]
MATILGIESTCDETAAAIVVDGFDVRTSVVASQAELHAKYRGVVPEIAGRAHIENILPVLREAIAFPPLPPGEGRGEGKLRESSSSGALTPTLSQRERGPEQNPFDSIDAIAVAHRPGLIGSLLIGVTAAKTLAWALGKPLVGVDHVHAHLYSVTLETNVHPPMPAVGLVCSGGHTSLYQVNDWLDVRLIGSTIDDAVGEAYDKVAAILGLGYPGGPILDQLAQSGDPTALRFPRTLLERESLDFSFSGLKTAVLYHVRGVPRRGQDVKTEPTRKLGEQQMRDIAASFQAACIDVIVEKINRATRHIGAKSVIIGGGVSANRGLRTALEKYPIPVFFPPLRYCTDNAAMSAGLAHVYFQETRFSDLSLDAITYSQFR